MNGSNGNARKRHTKQSYKQKHGQFFTENASVLLEGFEHLVEGRKVIDPFAGNLDLIKWAKQHGAIKSFQYDIDPRHKHTVLNDSILNPPKYDGKFLISNPPYLSRNKNKDKTAYDKWSQDDLYKCHLASLYPSCDDGILILPSNFMSESRSNARKLFFRHYSIRTLKYFYYSVFPNATTGIVVFDFYKNDEELKSFDIEIHYKDRIKKRSITIKPKYGYLYGDSFFDYIDDPDPIKVVKFDTESTSLPNTNIVIGLLSYGKYGLGAHYNEGEPLACGAKSFTTYQVSIDASLTTKQQRTVVKRYNEKLDHFIAEYDGLFLANYMGAEQKIKSRAYSNLLLSKVVKEELGVSSPSLLTLFE